jgi:hypothetical protein
MLVVALFISTQPSLAQFDEGVTALAVGDYAKALAAWQGSGAAGDAKAAYGMGYLYQFGLAVPADYGKAREWYEKAAAAQNPDALYALGLMYETGKLGGRDLKMAMDYYRKAVAAGAQYDAEYAIGRMILRGRGVHRDPTEGVKWLKTAAHHNQPAAQYMLGAAYEAGWGLPPDPQEAYYWYRRADDGDSVQLEEQDFAFQPRIAIAALRRALSAEAVAAAEARIRRDEAAPKGGDKPGPKAARKTAEPAPVPDSTTSDNDGLPKGALTRPP